MSNKMEINGLTVLEEDTIGWPRTPGHWTSEPEYKTVTLIHMATNWTTHFELITEEIPEPMIREKINTRHELTVTTFDGRKLILNPDFIIKTENLTMVTRKYYSGNPNFKKGEYTCRRLLPLGEKARFVEMYDSSWIK